MLHPHSRPETNARLWLEWRLVIRNRSRDGCEESLKRLLTKHLRTHCNTRPVFEQANSWNFLTNLLDKQQPLTLSSIWWANGSSNLSWACPPSFAPPLLRICAWGWQFRSNRRFLFRSPFRRMALSRRSVIGNTEHQVGGVARRLKERVQTAKGVQFRKSRVSLNSVGVSS